MWNQSGYWLHVPAKISTRNIRFSLLPTSVATTFPSLVTRASIIFHNFRAMIVKQKKKQNRTKQTNWTEQDAKGQDMTHFHYRLAVDLAANHIFISLCWTSETESGAESDAGRGPPHSGRTWFTSETQVKRNRNATAALSSLLTSSIISDHHLLSAHVLYSLHNIYCDISGTT